MDINSLRKHKFLGVAIFDMAGSILISSAIGRMVGTNTIFAGLVSIPLSLVVHQMFGIETELTKFFKESQHRFHGVAIGTVVGLASNKLAGLPVMTSVNIGLSTCILSSLYMKEYGHGLPPKLQRKMMKLYLKYWV